MAVPGRDGVWGQCLHRRTAGAEEPPPEDSFCMWCHHRDEREARKFIRDALKTTLPPM